MASVHLFNSAVTAAARAGCANCGLLAWSQASRLGAADAAHFNDLITHHRPVSRGAHLYHAGAALDFMHVIHSGFLVATTGTDDGMEQVTCFLMPGDAAGLDGIASSRHQCNTIAIEDSSVCGLAYADLERACSTFPALQHHFHCLLGSEINRDRRLMLLLGGMRAEERVAAFLLDLSTRFAARGYSPTEFKLPMRHQDIGSYLGLRLETMSRLFAKLGRENLITLDGRYIRINDIEALRQRLSDGERHQVVA